MKTEPKTKPRTIKVRAAKSAPMGDWPSVVKSGGGNNNFWRWGDDNMMPEALALMSRRSTIHRRIINDKADYISGKGVNSETGGQPLKNFMERANGDGESLRQVIHKLAFDKSLFGNAFMEVITDQAHSFLSLHHQDASHCRVARDESSIVMHHDWRRFKPAEARRLPLYPAFEVCKDGLMRSVVHYKDYEPMFRHYGVPSYIAGMNVSAIAYKTDRWNISRLDNSFQLSGVMLLEGLVDDDEQAEEILAAAEKKFAGQPGQVMFMITDSLGRDTSRFVPIAADNDGDWKRLHDQATGDIVVAHSWFRSLSGLDYSGGFSSERIMHEYEIALNTVIVPEQNDLLEPIKRVVASVTGLDASGMEVINRPPTRKKALYMKVWEARRDAGLDFDLDDPTQQLYIAQITKYNLESID